MAPSVCTFDCGVTKEWKVCVRLSDAGFQEKYRYHMVFFFTSVLCAFTPYTKEQRRSSWFMNLAA